MAFLNKIGSIVKSHYDHLAPSYDERWADYNNAQVQWVLQNWPLSNTPTSVLDVGCGTGLMLSQLEKAYPNIHLTGVDISPKMLEAAHAKTKNAKYINKDMNDPVTLGSLPQSDCVISLSVQHHMPDTDAYLKILRDLCAPNGTVYLSGFAIDGVIMTAAHWYFSALHPFYHKAYSSKALSEKINTLPFFKIEKHDIIKPDRFWRIQLYRLQAL